MIVKEAIMKQWKATVQTKWGDVEVKVNAPNQHAALQIIKGMYPGCRIIGNYAGRC